MAASTETVFKSPSLSVAICLTWFLVSLPAVSRPGLPLAFSSASIFLIIADTGGNLVTKVNVRSSKTVMTAGMI